MSWCRSWLQGFVIRIKIRSALLATPRICERLETHHLLWTKKEKTLNGRLILGALSPKMKVPSRSAPRIDRFSSKILNLSHLDNVFTFLSVLVATINLD